MKGTCQVLVEGSTLLPDTCSHTQVRLTPSMGRAARLSVMAVWIWDGLPGGPESLEQFSVSWNLESLNLT